MSLLPCLATNLPCQEETVDRDAEVAKAIEHRRFAVRRAVSGKLARSGDDAVPAIRRYEEKHGRQKISLILVDAIARSNQSGVATLDLLHDWAIDRDFYWRSQALGGLALRKREEHIGLFRKAMLDPAHLYRIEGARGLLLLSRQEPRPRVHDLLSDEDPRVRVAVGIMLVDAGDDAGLPALLEAMGRSERFLDDPWGARASRAAASALESLSSEDPESPEQAAAIKSFQTWRALLVEGSDPSKGEGQEREQYLGGLEIRSCRNGDLFLRWTALGNLVLGLEGRERVKVAAAEWRKLQDKLLLEESKIFGPVVCDYLRILDTEANQQQKVAPASLPGELATWLEQLCMALQAAGHGTEASALRARITQFK